MMTIRFCSVGCIALVCALTLTSTAGVPQRGERGPAPKPKAPETQVEKKEVVVPISNIRPLADAAKILQAKFGVPISYEDAPWENQADIIRTKDIPGQKDSERLNPDLLAPAVATLELRLTTDAKTKAVLQTPSETLQAVLDQHAERGNPGRFRLINLGQFGLSVVATQARNREGALVAVTSPLDAIVSFPDEERTTYDTVRLIGTAIGSATGQPVGVDLSGLPREQVIRIGAKAETARDVLARALRSIQFADPRIKAVIPKRSWRLLYDPKLHRYGLYLETVHFELAGNASPSTVVVNWPPPAK
jgi:hypothetical protein